MPNILSEISLLDTIYKLKDDNAVTQEQLDEALVSAQPDWNVNDETAPNYIKNRTHYSESVEITLVDNLTSAEYSAGNYPHCTFIVGQKYDIEWNGTLYKDLICYSDGHFNIIASSDNGCPFYIDDNGGNDLYVDGDDEDWILSISTIQEIVHKLDKKYLSQAADWNQNDKTAFDYIKGRTHWEEQDESDIVIYPTTLTIDEDGGARVIDVETPPLFVGERYIVLLNGVRYECVARDWDGEYTLLGNGTIDGDGNPGNNEPFNIVYSGGMFLTVAVAGEYTVSIVHVNIIVHPLDEKFIPNFKENRDKLDHTNIAYGTCSTIAGTAAKVVTITGNTQWKLEPGATIVVKFSYTNTASNPTLNVNGTGAKRIWYNTALLGTSSLNRGGYASRYITYVYDGTQYVFQSWSVDDASDTKVTQANTTSNTTYSVLLSYDAASTSSVTNTVNKSANLQFNPSTKTLTVENLAGNATSSDGVNWGSW